MVWLIRPLIMRCQVFFCMPYGYLSELGGLEGVIPAKIRKMLWPLIALPLYLGVRTRQKKCILSPFAGVFWGSRGLLSIQRFFTCKPQELLSCSPGYQEKRIEED